MAVNLTINCLKQVTDYMEFERLCNGLMSLVGYNAIEPLGGFSDKGRDAIHVSTSGETTIFAYSVREDWRAKLAEDAHKINDHNHVCYQLIFITTASITPTQRDEAVKSIWAEFGWKLELYGVDRLQILLDVTYPQIKHNHPGIFPPAILAIQNEGTTSAKQDHIFISSVLQDAVLAEWLTRKLTAEGYLVWYEKLKLLGGETYPDDVDDAIRHRTFRFLGLYSRSSTRNAEIMRQRSLALNMSIERKQDFVIPLDVDGICKSHLDQVAGKLKFIEFDKNWASGLQQLLEKLKSVDCPKPLSHAKPIAADAFLDDDLLTEELEFLYSNCFQIKQLPNVIYRFKSASAIPELGYEKLSLHWSNRRRDSNTFLSFHRPPQSLVAEFSLREKGGALWTEVEKIDGISSLNLASELIRKSLIVKCHAKGLQYCPKSKLPYFPSNLVANDRLYYFRPNGIKSYVNARGKRTYPFAREYLYSLAPTFFVRKDLIYPFTVIMRLRVHLSHIDGKPLTGKRTIDSRRKHLCKDWWNNNWLSRILAVSHFLAGGGETITIGEEQDEQIVIDAVPIHLHSPIGIDESVLDELSYERSELVRIHDNDNSDDDINIDPS